MKKAERTKRLPTLATVIILALVLAVSVAVSLIIYYTVDNEDPGTTMQPPEAIEGESVYKNYLLAYPTMDQAMIQYISVENSTGTFGVVKPDQNGDFVFYYKDENGKLTEYHPNIADIDDTFTYSTLFAIETNDGYNSVPKLTYLCNALRLPYVEQRIELIPEERDAQLDVYGFADGEYETVKFTYLVPKTRPKLDDSGNEILGADGKPVMENVLDDKGEQVYDEKSHSIKIGDKTTLGTGYYFMVDGRDYVYAGFNSHFDYAMLGFNSFVNSIVVSPALAADGVFAGFITSDYYQWLLEKHDTTGDEISKNSLVYGYVNTVIPVQRTDELEDGSLYTDGYFSSGFEDTAFDLYDYRNSAEHKRLLDSLIGAKLCDYTGNEMTVTLTSKSLMLDLSAAASLTYDYTVTGIESVITDTDELTAAGTPVGDNKLVKVTYKLKINGESASVRPLHAVIDLSDPLIPVSFSTAMRAESVGSLSESDSLAFSVTYTEDNAPTNQIEYIITDILEIFDKDGNRASKITDTSIVSYNFYLKVNGKYDSTEPYSTVIDLGADTSEDGARLKTLLKGRGVSSDLSISVKKYTAYYECIYDFVSYVIARLDSFVTRDMVSAFRFQNKSDRDPYYGESIYENTLENKYAIYGLNDGVCKKIVQVFSGLTENSSQAPAGLRGTETVAVGITPALMDKYGLYKHEIYFEIPRNLSVIESDSADTVDDYEWKSELGFTLYISDEDEEGYRYIASEAYDLIVKMPGMDFGFLEYNFVDFWSRREMMIVDVAYLENIRIEMNMEDMKGIYDMEVTHTDVYWTSTGDRYTVKPENIATDKADEIDVIITPSGTLTPNKLTEYMDKMGYLGEGGSGFVGLSQFYRDSLSGGVPHYVAREHIGIDDFKQMLQVIYFTGYSGTVPVAEQAGIIESAPMIFRFSFKLDEYTPNASPYHYVYEYYRYDDSRVLVRLYQAKYDAATGEYTPVTTPVSDFYITTFAMKKIISNWNNLFNLVDVDKEKPYN